MHPLFPISLNNILSTDSNGTTASVVFVSRHKNEPALCDFEVDFGSRAVATQWALRLLSIASKGM